MKKGGTVIKIKGDCYESNGKWMIGKDGYKLVHGVAMNQEDGKAMGHCWIEKDNTVYDYSNDKELIISKDIYYKVGQIPFEGYKLYKYSYINMAKMIIKHEHWGPWESKPPRQESKMNNDKIARAVDLIVDLGWEEQRMSRSGKETYNELCKLFKVMTTNETREILKKEKIMGKMAELDYLLQTGDKELLEEFFIERGFSKYSANKAKDEFTKAYEELQNYQKEEKSDGKKDTETKNIK